MSTGSSIENIKKEIAQAIYQKSVELYREKKMLNILPAEVISEMVSYIQIIPDFHVYCGRQTTFLLDTRGRIFCCGDNTDNRLGIGETKIRWTPQISWFMKDNHIVKISSSIYDTLYLDDQGQIFYSGYKGLSSQGSSTKLLRTLIGKKIKNMITTASPNPTPLGYFIFIDDSGQVLYDGIGGSDGPVRNLTTMPFPVKMEKLFSRGLFTCLIDINGAVYSYKMDPQYTFDSNWQKIKEYNNKNIIDIVILQENKLVFLNKKGEIIIWENNSEIPIKLDMPVIKICLNPIISNTIFLLTNNYKVYFLEIKPGSKPFGILINQEIISMASGETHTVFINFKGDVFSLGDNSKGQLGLGNKIEFTDKPTIIPDFNLDKVSTQWGGNFYAKYNKYKTKYLNLKIK